MDQSVLSGTCPHQNEAFRPGQARLRLVQSGFVRGYTGQKNILIGAPALAAAQKTPPLATGTLRSTTHLAMGAAKRGVFCAVLGEIGCRAANLAENTGNMGACLFWRAHLGTSVPAISGLSGRGGSVGSPASGQTGWESLGARWVLPCGPMSSPLKR